MICESFDHEGVRYTLCRSGHRGALPRCRVQGCSSEAPFLCDGPPSARAKRETCDLAICPEHAQEIGSDRHLCPACVANADLDSRQLEFLVD